MVFGGSSNLSTLDGNGDGVIALSDLNGTTGFRIDAAAAGDRAGASISGGGDINGDGIDDLVIGASEAASAAGQTSIIFGATSFSASFGLSTIDGTNGFRLDGTAASDVSGRVVSLVGDVDGDGFDDVLIGAPTADPGGNSTAGEAYLVLGGSTHLGALDGNGDGIIALTAMNGTDGFRFQGTDAGDRSGYSVSGAGDINGDGLVDLIIGVYRGDSAASDAGETFVVFGGSSHLTGLDGNGDGIIAITDIAGSHGFRIDGVSAGDQAGRSVSHGGDINGDGYDDLLIAAYSVDFSGAANAGATYVVFGGASVGSGGTLALSSLTSTTGLRLDGIDASDYSGEAVSAAGDVNGDGFDDLIIGAAKADPGGDTAAGESYVVFGGDHSSSVTHLGTAAADTLTGTSGANIMVGGLGGDIFDGLGGADVMRGGGGDDNLKIADLSFQRLDGGSGSDTLTLTGSGQNLNLATTSNLKITSIEKIDISGSGANTLTLKLADVLDISDTVSGGKTTLQIDGDDGDTVSADNDSWGANGSTEIGEVTYNIYDVGLGRLLINESIGATDIGIPPS